MKLSIMQPYFFPYLGYYQLVMAADTFVFLDDVNYINRGWINRNRILMNGTPQYFTVPLEGASQNRLISEIEIQNAQPWKRKMLQSFQHNYSKAPFYTSAMQVVHEVLDTDHTLISDLCEASVKAVMRYLGVEKNYHRSSELDTDDVKAQERILAICRSLGASIYINPVGGVDLYEPTDFEKNGMDLRFCKMQKDPYTQWGDEFVDGLSIIDHLMFRSTEDIIRGLGKYSLLTHKEMTELNSISS